MRSFSGEHGGEKVLRFDVVERGRLDGSPRRSGGDGRFGGAR
jgi:hypothetical protein